MWVQSFHSFIHSFIHSFMHTFIRSVIHSISHSAIHGGRQHLIRIVIFKIQNEWYKNPAYIYIYMSIREKRKIQDWNVDNVRRLSHSRKPSESWNYGKYSYRLTTTNISPLVLFIGKETVWFLFVRLLLSFYSTLGKKSEPFKIDRFFSYN